MNLIYAQVVEVYPEAGEPMGKVNVWGVLRAVPLRLVPEARPGDTVLVCDGVAIGKVNGGFEEAYSVSPGVTPGALAGGDACAALKGAKDVSGSTR
jgi:hydrogenase maturation factor